MLRSSHIRLIWIVLVSVLTVGTSTRSRAGGPPKLHFHLELHCTAHYTLDTVSQVHHDGQRGTGSGDETLQFMLDLEGPNARIYTAGDTTLAADPYRGSVKFYLDTNQHIITDLSGRIEWSSIHGQHGTGYIAFNLASTPYQMKHDTIVLELGSDGGIGLYATCSTSSLYYGMSEQYMLTERITGVTGWSIN